ncbi:hypothetical protein ANCCEY_12269 [Ancylostoma ceylanicum]|uniref:DUF5641 domain-containing protein n=2 Tax=Ancylostoma ceylanicum TaxID=53326 RepID=A0A0D6L9L8_9BILA|nr:hypothetical protein ANCCEY_12269 [Ancylostoma ceylanicum]EYC03935.1 hypothetical protein Y032_0091g2508 [Ancylostoma ceylanicum]
MVIALPFESLGNDEADASYLLPDKAAQLRFRKQAEDALKTSHQYTERFWKLMNKQYLISLRESHKLQIDKRWGAAKVLSVGKIVLISEAVMPRNTWKMARITKLLPSRNNVVQEVELRLPNGRTIRRPVNLIVPLELEDYSKECDTNPVPDLREQGCSSANNDEMGRIGATLQSPISIQLS